MIAMLETRGSDDPGSAALLHDRMEARIRGYGVFVETWDKLNEEGFFADLLSSIAPEAAVTAQPSVDTTKLEQVKAVARGCGMDEEHSLQVAKLALMLFDCLRSLHRLGDAERDLLEYAGVLHDIGWKNGQRAHHKSSLQMIMGDAQLPFDERERAMVANVARYHRGALPSDDHGAYRSMKSSDRATVDRLASIIRVADALDVSHASVVQSVACRVKKGSVVVLLRTSGYADRELEKVRTKRDLFEKVFKRTLMCERELA